MARLIWICLFLSPSVSFILNKNTISIDTNVGSITGKIEDVTVDDKEVQVAEFLGIPFAEPPVGQLRFAKPVKKGNLSSPYNATEFGRGCLQVKNLIPGRVPELSEDCLFLNIFVPGAPSPANKLAVMVWIYGGGFKAGYSNGYNAATLAGFGDVIVVTLNYRLGVFGFLSTGDKYAPGNYGLWDQQLAIEWVHDNIAAFGGDSETITIFGESTGSISTVYQALYPGNKGLLKRVISESGSVNSPRTAFTSNPEMYAETLAKALGCDQNSTAEYMKCLQSKSDSDIDTMVNNPQTGLGFLPWTPVRDDDFVSYNPYEIFTKQMASSKERECLGSLDFMTGVNSLEGALLVGYFAMVLNVSSPEDIKVSRNSFENMFVPDALTAVFGSEISPAATKATIFEYTNWTDPNNQDIYRDTVVQMASHYTFYAPAVETMNAKVITNSTTASYFYKFSTRPSTHFLPVPSWLDGDGMANHEDEVPFVFGFDQEMLDYNFINGYNVTRDEMEVSKLMMTMWTNFAKTG